MVKLLKELGPFVRRFRPYWRRLAAGSLLGLATLAAGVGLMALSGWFISAAAFAGLAALTAQQFNFFFPSIGVRLFAIGRTAARYAERVVGHDATFRLLKSLRVWFYNRLEPLAPARLMAYPKGDILNRIVADIDALDNLYVRILSPTAAAVVLWILVYVCLRILDPRVAIEVLMLLMVAGTGVPALALYFGSRIGVEMTRQNARLRVRIVDTLEGLSELIVFATHRTYLAAADAEQKTLIASQRRMSHISGAAAALVTVLTGVCLALALYTAAGRVEQGLLDGAYLALIALGVLAAFESVAPLPAAYQYLGQTREAARRLLEVVEIAPAVCFPDHSDGPIERYDIQFEAVCFRYPGKTNWALQAIDLSLEQGSKTALVGATGAGKTSLVNLLARFWDPTDGRILVGGRDIRTFSETDLRCTMGVVSQQAHLFNATIRDNLRIADPEANDAHLRAALEAVRLETFVAALPDGLDTWVGESGRMLSGGQGRRLAIARAVLRDAPIWILDEPTEGLDRGTEQELLDALAKLTSGKTVLMITHRPAALAGMDRVVTLENSRIA